MLRFSCKPALFAIFLTVSHLCVAQSLTVAAAADLQFAMPEVVARFEQQTGAKVNVIYGSSGNFAQQIQNGAPFDIFFSADVSYPQQLQSAGLVVPDTLYKYARGKIVLWAPSGSRINLSQGLRSLEDAAVKKVAIANPQHAPYGKAAVAAMQKEGVYDAVKPKLVLGENISQAASFVASGAADVGIVALSLALSPNMMQKGHYFEVAPADYPPLEQACVILRSAKQQELARRFLEFLRTAAAAAILQRYGFEPLSASPSPTELPAKP